MILIYSSLHVDFAISVTQVLTTPSLLCMPEVMQHVVFFYVSMFKTAIIWVLWAVHHPHHPSLECSGPPWAKLGNLSNYCYCSNLLPNHHHHPIVLCTPWMLTSNLRLWLDCWHFRLCVPHGLVPWLKSRLPMWDISISIDTFVVVRHCVPRVILIKGKTMTSTSTMRKNHSSLVAVVDLQRYCCQSHLLLLWDA